MAEVLGTKVDACLYVDFSGLTKEQIRPKLSDTSNLSYG